MTTAPESLELALADEIAACYADPLRFVKLAYPWGEPGPLQSYPGPDIWQEEFLTQLGEEVRARGFNGVDAVPPIRFARTSGHGIGKGVMVGWLVGWILSTRPNCQGTVTANTFPQLETKTWATIQKWMKLCITNSWFEITGSMIYRKGHRASWFVSAQTCREENSEAFAGQHAADSTSFYIFDESSNIPEKIFEVAEGGLTDGEPMMFAFGNPTRRTGRLFEICFGRQRDRWNAASIDSRTSKFTNKAYLAELLQDYGEDSDRFRVQVRGLAPVQGDFQFIDSDRIWAAQKRPAGHSLNDDPLICGVDVARGGGDWNAIRFRRGMDAKSIPAQRIPGEQTRDSTLLTSKLALLLSDQHPDRKIAMMFVDSAFGGPVVNRLRQLGHKNVTEINFGSGSPDAHQANMRAYMWSKMKDWLLMGSIDPTPRLETDLSGPGYHHNNRDQLVLESKEDMQKRGLDSPDDGDALALTFAQVVAPPRAPSSNRPRGPLSPWS